jgi:hypothetical protein
MQTLAVAPVRDLTQSRHADLAALGEALAAALLATRRFQVIYPHEFARTAQSRPARRDIPVTDEVRSLEGDAGLVAAAAHLQADAVLVVSVLAYQPYYPPRLAVRARLYATAASSPLDSRRLLEMTDDGMPAEVPAALQRRFLWSRDHVFDGHDLPEDLDTHRQMRSMRRYFTYGARELAAGLTADLAQVLAAHGQP